MHRSRYPSFFVLSIIVFALPLPGGPAARRDPGAPEAPAAVVGQVQDGHASGERGERRSDEQSRRKCERRQETNRNRSITHDHFPDRVFRSRGTTNHGQGSLIVRWLPSVRLPGEPSTPPETTVAR